MRTSLILTLASVLLFAMAGCQSMGKKSCCSDDPSKCCGAAKKCCSSDPSKCCGSHKH